MGRVSHLLYKAQSADLQRHVQADLVAVFELVRHGFGHAGDPLFDAIAFDFLAPAV